MHDTRFDQPVRLKQGEQIELVSDASQASHLLLRSWPATRGKWYHAATRACARASEGKTLPHVARSVFEKAAQESRLI